MNEAGLDARMRRQFGLISRSQALDAGMTQNQIQHRLNTGRWERARAGVFRHSAVPETRRSRLLAACISLEGLASHRSAAALHDIDGYRLEQLEVVVAYGRGRGATGVLVHRSTQMGLARPVERDNIPCTGIGRTVLDLASVVSRKRLELTIDAVVREGKLRYQDLYGVLAAHARRGRPGLGRLRDVLDARCGDEPVPLSDWSRWVCDLLSGAGLARPMLEYRVHDAEGKFIAQVDLAYPTRRLAIELDSVRWHHNRESFITDRRRRNRLQAAGWDVLNFTWEDYAARPLELCNIVQRAHDFPLQTVP